MKYMSIVYSAIVLFSTPLFSASEIYPNVSAKTLNLSDRQMSQLEQLHHLASSPQSRTAELTSLFAHGASQLVNVIYDYSTALIKAAEELYPNVDNITFLLDHGADINARDARGSTAIMRAIEFSLTMEPIELLLERGADLHLTNRHGKSAAYIAERSRNKKIEALVRKYL